MLGDTDGVLAGETIAVREADERALRTTVVV
jgi:hypothetical protein